MELYESPEAIARVINGCRYLNAEFMYRPRPQSGRERAVFDFTLSSRLKALGSRDAVLFICDSRETADSLAGIQTASGDARPVFAITNPPLWMSSTPDTPYRLRWETPEGWRRCRLTDRWARLDFALEVASRLTQPGYLVLPAHDVIWGHDLLPRLVQFSRAHARRGQPAAVSPYTWHQHAPVPGVDIPQDVIDLLNAAFARDNLLPWRIRFDRVQAFWGKMGMIPFSICGALRAQTEKIMWEDDLEIDRAIRELGFGVRCLWVRQPALYRQSPPVFDREGVRKVIERTLHYSLNIPGDTVSSVVNAPLDALGRLRVWLSPRFARLNAEVEGMAAECVQVITRRLQEVGASWVDWGAYRYVCRVGDPAVEVWKHHD